MLVLIMRHQKFFYILTLSIFNILFYPKIQSLARFMEKGKCEIIKRYKITSLTYGVKTNI